MKPGRSVVFRAALAVFVALERIHEACLRVRTGSALITRIYGHAQTRVADARHGPLRRTTFPKARDFQLISTEFQISTLLQLISKISD